MSMRSAASCCQHWQEMRGPARRADHAAFAHGRGHGWSPSSRAYRRPRPLRPPGGPSGRARPGPRCRPTRRGPGRTAARCARTRRWTASSGARGLSGRWNSSAWQAASSSIARMRRVFATTRGRLARRRRRPSTRGLPCWPRSGWSRRWPGARASCSRRPGPRPSRARSSGPSAGRPARVRNAGRPGERGVDQPLDAPLADGPELGDRDGEHVGGQRDRLAVEVAAARAARPCRRTPSGCRWRRSSRSRPCARRTRARRARRRGPGACSAGCRRPAPCRSRGATRGCGLPASRRAQVARGRAPGPGAGARRGCAGRRRRRVPLSASRVSAPATSAVRASRQRLGQRQAGHRGHELRAVDERQPFLRLQRDGREARRAAAPRRADAASPSRHSPSPISARARCASGARSPLAPTDPCAGHQRDGRRAFSIAEQQLERLRPHAAEALGQHVRAQQHERARLRLVAADRRRRRRGCARG